MKASICRQYGVPSVLRVESHAKPQPTSQEILVKVAASTVNRTDCAILSARPFIMRFFTGLLRPNKAILGTEFSGEVVEIGTDVTSFRIGDRVFGFHDLGLSAHAEYLSIAPTQALANIPDYLNFEQAAASIEGAHYAYNYLNKVGSIANKKILINGASGAIGSALLQFCVGAGAEVVAVSEGKNCALLMSLGAGRVIDYKSTDFTAESATYDFVFDVVGTSSYVKCLPILSESGIYISSELGEFWQNIYLPLLTSLFCKRKVIFPMPAAIRESLNFILEQLDAGKYRPVLDRSYSLDEVTAAFEYVQSGMKLGNVILEIDAKLASVSLTSKHVYVGK